ncbi:hypothetical protein D2V17_12190 [Aurantiacibacter xanthus]|uniref:Uncharacterized protein n=1 Tax=Aurantiacibacter xanthus TaxID=1784712 RepID=A0A3A1P7H6_9SPHN|nr:hypothetical protein [Aurantiacibacter xanthus]RIV83984.1 hypothetical protein D2V17_12190 [Aurantiacibacter xanthus]|tara:strand:- start:16983 stop:17246 length:264 start_codon:yes stop_codon:yes gene_type:complete
MAKSAIGQSIRAWGRTLSLFLLITYFACIAFGLGAPEQMHMHRAWATLLPGFEWLTLSGFIAGAVGSFLYAAILLVPLYNHFSRRAG